MKQDLINAMRLIKSYCERFKECKGCEIMKECPSTQNASNPCCWDLESEETNE